MKCTATVTLITQGAAPKKPYNPVLGEVFRCYWDIPGGRRTAPNADEHVRTIHFLTEYRYILPIINFTFNIRGW